MTIRIVNPKLAISDYQGPEIPILTRLLDRDEYPAEMIDSHYGNRWSVETHLNEIKNFTGPGTIARHESRGCHP